MMSAKNRDDGIVREIDRLERHHFVGREREIRFFSERLTDTSGDFGIINIYGTGGIGKSYLLDEYRRLAEKAEAAFVYVDFRFCAGSPSEFCACLMRALTASSDETAGSSPDAAGRPEPIVRVIRAVARERKLVLAFDTFEESGEIEHWLREQFLPLIIPEVLVVIAGRFPLHGAWLASPVWRRWLFLMPLADLAYEDVRLYLCRSGIADEENIARIWTRTKGHPLTLSLLASTALVQTLTPPAPSDNDGIFHYVVKVWLKEVTSLEMRDLVETAAVLRQFNQELLSFVLGREVSAESFLAMIGHSFVRRTERGWMLHDMLRDAIGYELRLRSPEYYDRLWKRCAKFYYLQLSKAMSGKTVDWAKADWVYYIADRLIRTLFYQQLVFYPVEPLQPSNWAEAERYIGRRLLGARDTRIVQKDPESGERYEYAITAEESLLSYKPFELKRRYDADRRSVKLIRNASNEVCGLVSIVPIHERTLDFLLSHSPFYDYFSSLSQSELAELEAPQDAVSGYFIELIDVCDYADTALRQVAGMTFIHHMLSAGLIVTTAPSIPFFHAIFDSLGLERVADIVHFGYGDSQPAPYYVLDTRGQKMNRYLDKIASAIGIEFQPAEQNEALKLLSVRERGVFRQLIDGRSNMEIAVELCLSEATVKKHVSNIFRKLRVKSRAQLINRYFNTTFG